MMNGTGLRVCLWCSGCDHHCKNCQNPITWDPNDGAKFDIKAKNEIFNELSKDYISGITLTGGDPLHQKNLESVLDLVNEIRLSYPEKTIWLYSGYTWEQIMYPVVTNDFNPERDKFLKMRREIVKQCDVLVDGRYEEDKRDVTYHWAGSTNQRVIDVKKTLEQGSVILWENQ
jgi:anaerobic ribonucleoside-triphosphate reductase activating protein